MISNLDNILAINNDNNILKSEARQIRLSSKVITDYRDASPLTLCLIVAGIHTLKSIE